MKRYFLFALGTALGVIIVVLLIQMNDSQKRKIIHLIKQVPFLPARYFV